MPRVFKIGSYVIYFWMNENNPLEPVHVHVCEGVPSPTATKIRFIMQTIEARSKDILDLWYTTFKNISFYC